MEGKTQRMNSNGDGRAASIVIVTPHHVIERAATPTLLGTHNPERFRPENKVFRVVLRWNPLHGLRLAKIEEENQRSRTTRPTTKLTRSSPILFGTRDENETGCEQQSGRN